MRADARRNRDRIVEVAREIFRERGYDASLDEIAKRAGVGPGTLYRHFPTRDALLDAVMQVWVDRVTETTDKSLTYEGPPREFLVGWFEAYVALISLHKGGSGQDHLGDGRRRLPHRHQDPGAASAPPSASSTTCAPRARCATTSTRSRCAASSAVWPSSPTRATSTPPPSAPCSPYSPTASCADGIGTGHWVSRRRCVPSSPTGARYRRRA